MPRTSHGPRTRYDSVGETITDFSSMGGTKGVQCTSKRSSKGLPQRRKPEARPGQPKGSLRTISRRRRGVIDRVEHRRLRALVGCHIDWSILKVPSSLWDKNGLAHGGILRNCDWSRTGIVEDNLNSSTVIVVNNPSQDGNTMAQWQTRFILQKAPVTVGKGASQTRVH